MEQELPKDGGLKWRLESSLQGLQAIAPRPSRMRSTMAVFVFMALMRHNTRSSASSVGCIAGSTPPLTREQPPPPGCEAGGVEPGRQGVG
jgi:hypothetical protein